MYLLNKAIPLAIGIDLINRGDIRQFWVHFMLELTESVRISYVFPIRFLIANMFNITRRGVLLHKQNKNQCVV